MTRQRGKVGPGKCLGGCPILIRATAPAFLQRDLAFALHAVWCGCRSLPTISPSDSQVQLAVLMPR